MRVYFDTCCFNRPFDDQDALSVRLETEAKLHVQSLVKSGVLALGWSYILDFENAANPFAERRAEIQKWRGLADKDTAETPRILDAMKDATAKGIKPLDALHLACALALPCDFFLTVDKGVLRKSGAFAGIRICSPIDFVMEREI